MEKESGARFLAFSIYIMNYIACLTLKSHNKRTLSHVHCVCDMYVNLVLKRIKNILGRIGFNFWGFGDREPQQNYRLGTVSNEFLGGLIFFIYL